MTTMRRFPLVAAALGVAVLGAALVLLAQHNSGPATPAASVALVRSLCASRDDAGRGDANSAYAEFYNHTHQAIHDLAAQIQTRDRATEGQLLEAMQRVEADLVANPVPDDLVSQFSALGDRVRDAAVAAGQPRPQTC